MQDFARPPGSFSLSLVFVSVKSLLREKYESKVSCNNVEVKVSVLKEGR